MKRKDIEQQRKYQYGADDKEDRVFTAFLIAATIVVMAGFVVIMICAIRGL